MGVPVVVRVPAAASGVRLTVHEHSGRTLRHDLADRPEAEQEAPRPAAKVASSAWSSPPASAEPRSSPRADASKAMETRDAAAIRDASSASPSDTSIMAVAPAAAATAPSDTGGAGRSCAARSAASAALSVPASTATGVPAASRKRSKSRPRPRPAAPSSPATATTSPTRAPPRSTGAAPSSEPSAVTAIVSVSDTVRSPPSTAQPGARVSHAARRPSARPSTNDTGVVPGMARATSSAVGRAPIAATSARLTAAAFQPRSNALDQARRKSGPCTSVSVVATTRPSGAARTAASSPGPTAALDGAKRARMRRRTAPSESSPTEGSWSGSRIPPR